MSMRVLLLVAGFAAAVGLALTDRAGACSCAELEPRDALPTAEAAVVGTIVDDGDPATLRVEERVKGDVPDEIELPHDEDSDCSALYEEDQRIGLILSRDDDGDWTAGPCDSVDADELLRAARELPEARGRGTAALIAMPFGDVAGLGALLLDAEGEILAYGYGDGWPSSICPGSTHMVGVVGEGRQQRLVTRRLRDLAVVHTIPLPRDEVFASACLDRRGRRVAVVDGVFDEPVPVRSRLRLVGDGPDRTLRRGKIFSATFIGGTAYLDEGRWGQELVALDLRTGAARDVARVPEIPGRWHLSPDGRLLATTAYGRGEPTPSYAVVVDLRSGRVRKRLTGGSVLWAGTDRLLSDGGEVQLLDARLRTLRRGGDGIAEKEIVSTRGRVYALDYGQLYEIDPRTAEPRKLATLPSRAFRALIAIPGGAEVRTKRGAAVLNTHERRIIRAALTCRRFLW